MIRRWGGALEQAPAWGLALALLALLALPMVGLALSATPADLAAGARHPLFWPALSLSMRTTAVSLIVVVATGTPLAWWLATAPAGRTRAVEVLVDLPIVLPPAVVGVALLETFGRSGLFGPTLAGVGIRVFPDERAAVRHCLREKAPCQPQAADQDRYGRLLPLYYQVHDALAPIYHQLRNL